MSDGSEVTVLCSSVSKFCIFYKDVICVKRGMVDNALVEFILYVLMKLYSVG